MMIWVFAFKLGWFPVGKFLDPLVWREADVSANYVFGNMLLSVAAYVVFALHRVMLLPQAIRPQNTLSGGLAGRCWAESLIALAAWSFSGIGGLALDILKHMVLPVANPHAHFLCRNHVADAEQHAGNDPRGLRHGGPGQGTAREARCATSHAARNALLPVVTSLVYSLIFAIDGSVIIEGSLLLAWHRHDPALQAVRSEDLPLVMGAMLFIGMLSLAQRTS